VDFLEQRVSLAIEDFVATLHRRECDGLRCVTFSGAGPCR
jgi:hypothetical protein